MSNLLKCPKCEQPSNFVAIPQELPLYPISLKAIFIKCEYCDTVVGVIQSPLNEVLFEQNKELKEFLNKK